MRQYAETIRRFLVFIILSCWFGGFTFYSTVVIHVGHRVFESRVETGFLTEQVTNWLNVIGIIAAAAMLWELIALWARVPRLLRNMLAATWIIFAAIQGVLIALHPVLDRMLDFETHKLLDRVRFEHWHSAYVSLSTAQWIAMLINIGCIVVGHREFDKRIGGQHGAIAIK